MDDSQLEKLNDVIEDELGSDCCGAAVYVLGDSYICTDCKEYCDVSSEE